jgi:hypothetical protein
LWQLLSREIVQRSMRLYTLVDQIDLQATKVKQFNAIDNLFNMSIFRDTYFVVCCGYHSPLRFVCILRIKYHGLGVIATVSEETRKLHRHLIAPFQLIIVIDCTANYK